VMNDLGLNIPQEDHTPRRDSLWRNSDLHATSHPFTPESLLDWFPCSTVFMTAGQLLQNAYQSTKIRNCANCHYRYLLILFSNFFQVQSDHVRSSIDDP
jgi:hypothetical protein